jgi:UDP-N-acetylglucosamine 4-epimerase
MSLNELAQTLRALIVARHPGLQVPAPLYGEFRAGDVRHSQADIGKAQRLLGYVPTHDVRTGLAEALAWYEAQCAPPDRETVTDGADAR